MAFCPQCNANGPDVGGHCPTDPAHRLVAESAREHVHDPLLGTVVSGRFTVVDVAGEGGIGTVYEAVDQHTVTGERIALKVLKRSQAGDETSRQRFFREAEILTHLEHSNIVKVFDCGELGDGSKRLYMAMEYVEGRGVDEVLTDQPGRLDEPTALLALLHGTAAALAEAHRQNAIHRDLKPSNIMLLEDGSVRVVDFGIARAGLGKSTLTKTGMLFGTPAYMSPEQAMGDTELGPAVDVYAFGVILFELLTGKRPFDAPQPLVLLMAHVNDPIPALIVRRGLESMPELCELTTRCLAKDPQSRPANGEALQAEIEAIANRHGVTLGAPGLAHGALARMQGGTHVDTGLSRANPPPGNTKTAPLREKSKSNKPLWIATAAVGLLGVIVLIVGMAVSEEDGDGATSATGQAAAPESEESPAGATTVDEGEETSVGDSQESPASNTGAQVLPVPGADEEARGGTAGGGSVPGEGAELPEENSGDADSASGSSASEQGEQDDDDEEAERDDDDDDEEADRNDDEEEREKELKRKEKEREKRKKRAEERRKKDKKKAKERRKKDKKKKKKEEDELRERVRKEAERGLDNAKDRAKKELEERMGGGWP